MTHLGVAAIRRNIWWAKIGAKIVLSRLGLSYRAWKRLGVFVHGQMDDPARCFASFHTLLTAAGFPPHGRAFATAKREERNAPFVVVELGPGDSLYSALLAYAHGADRCVLVDDGRFAHADIEGFRAVARLLADRGISVSIVEGAASGNEVLSRCNAEYLTDGVNALHTIPSSTVDFLYSNAVLEHVRRDKFAELLHETRRILKPHGCSFHRVDLQDHVGGALNNLRFPAAVWESRFMARSGFYTNRIRYREMLNSFRSAGFSIEVKRELRWPALPTPRSKLHRDFRELATDDLLVYGFDVTLRPI